MGIEENKQLVVEFLGHYSAARYEAALDMLAEDSEWWLPGHSDEFPAAGTVGKDTVRKRLARNLKLLPNGLEITLGAVTAEEDRVAVEAESKGVLTNGRLYHNRYHFLFVVGDGRIRLVKEYLDTLHAREALGSVRPAG